MSGFFHTYPSVGDIDNNFPQHSWIVSCTYMDDDGVNYDIIDFTDYHDAWMYFASLADMDNLWDLSIHPCDAHGNPT